MKKDVQLDPASEDQPCHWCKAGFVFVADQAIGTGKTVLCKQHLSTFVTTFHEPDPQVASD